ncbi:MAG: TIGR04282 family arsenosugar biosynthesis glycosyltransferase [Euryhalocaulis sp.]|uniref:TIGR04282 family arsenosugar biosynthesis glycosyltransferase n=1 Tax=Euryhalocaulis sp. TaxID=2744307 RepID=UPI0017E7CABA|nr:TIGR04282 family arsenosugar biosynthesis glycosyltransferase [Euryhalocaulis sp.]MBA4801559.1 TIGR04282 family arsenosugar biosynthesis glycosyltransferase [Euryhalocaulis sp.]
MRPRLVIFAKPPAMGRAKTRLAADIGPVPAMRLYRAMVAHILRNTRDPRWKTLLALPDDSLNARHPVWPPDLPRMPQGPGDLGARQARAFSAPMTVVIGTDTPDVTARDIAAALAALRRSEAVIGPAEDGGYWLLGLKGPARPGLFDGVRWSHANTLNDLEKRLPRPIMRLAAKRDIDDGTDL